MGSVGGWVEGVILSIMFTLIFGVILTAMNYDYNKNYETGIVDNVTLDKMTRFMGESQNITKGGEVTADANSGITILEVWGMFSSIIDILWNFISGGWIEKTVSMLNLGAVGDVLSLGLRILYFMSLIFAVLYAIFKVVT